MKRLVNVFLMIAILSLLFTGSALGAKIMFDNPNDFDVLSPTHWRYDFNDNGEFLGIPGVLMDVYAWNGEELTWDSSDQGIGIDDDEITGGKPPLGDIERLNFSFSMPFYISKFYIVDLFPNEQGGNEQLFYTIDGPGVIGPLGPGDNSGDFELTLDTIIQERITFFADSWGFSNGYALDNSWNDFAVAGFEGAPVPEPGTIILLGAGLLGLVTYGRKRKIFNK